MRSLRLLTLALAGLSSPHLVRAADAKVTYDDHVVPILRDKCFACHNQDRKSGGLRLNTYTNLMAGGASGAPLKPGDPDGSLLYKLMTHKEEPFMPPKSPLLPKESLDTVRRWIEGGALENSGSKLVVVNKPKYDIALDAVAKGKPQGPPPMPQKLPLEPVVTAARPSAVTAIASSPWAPVVAVAGQKQVLLYHAETLAPLGILPFPEGTPHVLKFSRNGGLLLAGGGYAGKSGRVVVWNVTTGERIFAVGEELDAVLAADLSADQSLIALGGPSKVVRIYSTRDGKLQHEIRKHTDWIYTLEFSPDGVLLATGDRNGGLFVWEAHTAREYFGLRGHTAAINAVSWRGDSNVLASASEDGTIRLWEMENGGNFKSWGHGAPVQWVAYAHDGRLVSCGRDRVAKLWDGNGGAQRTFEALPDVALRVTFSHDGARILAGDWSGQVRVWSTADGKPLGQLPTNPPPLAQRLENAVKEVAARQTAHDQAAAAANAAAAAAQKAAAELAASQKGVADATAAAKSAADAQAKAKAVADQAAAAVPAAQSQAAAKDVLAKALAEAAAKVQATAEKAKDNKDLAAALARARDLANQAAAELAAAQKAVADQAAAAQAAAAQLAAATQAAQQASAAVTAATKLVETRTAQVTAANTQAAAAKAAADQAAAALAAAKNEVDWYRAAVASKPAR